jgi:hypothetical protein
MESGDVTPLIHKLNFRCKKWDQLHTPDVLHPGRNFPDPTDQETAWFPEPIMTLPYAYCLMMQKGK